MNVQSASEPLKKIEKATVEQKLDIKRDNLACSTSISIIGPAGLYNEGLRHILQSFSQKIITEYPKIYELEYSLTEKMQLILITDPTSETGLADILTMLRTRSPSVRIIVFVEPSRTDQIDEALRIPAHAFLSSAIGCDTLIKTIDLVLRDSGVLSMDVLSYLLSRPGQNCHSSTRDDLTKVAIAPSFPLSPREIEVLGCLSAGTSNKLIARRFDIAESTVKIHVKTLLRKLRLQNRTQAAVWAIKYYPSLVPIASMPEIDMNLVGLSLSEVAYYAE